MARVLVVGCGGRGQALAEDLAHDGHAVRGTSRDPVNLAAIEASGAEGVQADPDRLGTLMPHLAGVTVVCWLMGTADADEQSVLALHTSRLESLLAKLVDSGARGLVYEGAGSVPAAVLVAGGETTRAAGRGNRMPVAVTVDDPADHAAWLSGMRAAIDTVLAR
ncbi:MAG: NAD(P)H-binding protein [Thermoleophilaceae bacterium]